MMAMEQKLREALSWRKKRAATEANVIASAVLVPVYNKEGQYYILFTKRTDRVREHKGQVSFPGGARHKGDRTMLDTALRECAEEIGLAPGDAKVLGELDDALTDTSHYVISPFVALIPYPYQFNIDEREVKQIIEIPVAVLLDGDSPPQTRVIEGKATTSYFYHYGGEVIWGATAHILHQFLGIFSRVASE